MKRISAKANFANASTKHVKFPVLKSEVQPNIVDFDQQGLFASLICTNVMLNSKFRL